MYGISVLAKEQRQQIAESVRTQLKIERVDAIEKNKVDLIKEIDKKLASLEEIYKLNVPE